MGIPTNKKPKNCTSTSSNCVIWEGKNIPCVGLCTGDTIDEVTYKLGLLVCELQEQQSLDNYDVICLTSVGQISDFKGMIQNIITKLCNLETQVNQS